MIVFDVSAMVEILLGTTNAGPYTERALAPKVGLHAPHLLDVEVAQVLRRYIAMGLIRAERGRQALRDLADFPIER